MGSTLSLAELRTLFHKALTAPRRVEGAVRGRESADTDDPEMRPGPDPDEPRAGPPDEPPPSAADPAPAEPAGGPDPQVRGSRPDPPAAGAPTPEAAWLRALGRGSTLAQRARDVAGPRVRAFVVRHWALLAVLAVALSLRLTNLLPLHYYGDDAEYAIVAQYLADDVRDLSYPDLEGFGDRPFVSQPPLMLYLFALGGSVVGSMELGAVLVSVVLGTATVGLVYGLGVLLQGRTSGTLASVFLAVLPIHVELSRKALLDAGLVFFMTLTLVAFVVWTRAHTRRAAVAVGVAAACTMLAKLPGILVVLPLAAGLAWEMRGHALALMDPARRAAARADVRVLGQQVGWAGLPIAIGGSLYLGLLWFLQATQDLADKLGWQWGRVADARTDSFASGAKPWHWYFTDPHFGVVAQFGWALLALAGAGALLLLAFPDRRSSRTARTAVVAWPIAVLAFFTLSGRKEGFYLLPVAPGLALLAGLAAGSILSRARPERLMRRFGLEAKRRPTMAVMAAALFLAAWVPTATPMQRTWDYLETDRPWGYGVKEAALFIHERDPEAAQVGTLLGRYPLHFYNGQTTYFWHLPHTFIEHEIQAGRVRYVVLDTYLGLDYEEDWMLDLVARYDGQVVQESEVWTGAVTVRVYELHPTSA